MSYTLGIGGLWFGEYTTDGGGSTFNIAHGLDPQPDYAIVVPGSSNAAYSGSTALSFFIQITSTNIVVNYNTSTTSGTDNITLFWMAGRKYSIRDEIFSVSSDSLGDDDVP